MISFVVSITTWNYNGLTINKGPCTYEQTYK